MPRYVDADKAPSIMKKMPMGKQVIDVVMKYVIDRLPSEDVVEVVRCRDCRQSALTSIDGVLYCFKAHNTVKCEDYCSYGERRESNGRE